MQTLLDRISSREEAWYYFDHEELRELEEKHAIWEPIARAFGHTWEEYEDTFVACVHADKDKAHLERRFASFNVGESSTRNYREWVIVYHYETKEAPKAIGCQEHFNACEPFPGGLCGWLGATTFDYEGVAHALGVPLEPDEDQYNAYLADGYDAAVAMRLSALWMAREALAKAMGWVSSPECDLEPMRCHLVQQISRKEYKILTKWDHGGILWQRTTTWVNSGIERAGYMCKQEVEKQRESFFKRPAVVSHESSAEPVVVVKPKHKPPKNLPLPGQGKLIM